MDAERQQDYLNLNQCTAELLKRNDRVLSEFPEVSPVSGKMVDSSILAWALKYNPCIPESVLA
ncbi:MAG TPA: hypothetical protein V6C91_00110 [Coleofasciculaceae cyanobacterium]